MLPDLFTISIPAGLAAPLLALAALGLALLRAWAFRRHTAGEGGAVGWGAALWGDRIVLAALVVAVAVPWRAGALDRPLALPVHTYGLMIALGFVAAVALAQREARRVGLEADRIADLAFWVLVAALVGSRLYFIGVNASDYFGAGAWLTVGGVRIPRVLAVWEGGLVFYGGFMAAVLASWLYMRRHGMSFLPYADTIIPSVALGHAFGRLGCFSAGCCWGAVSSAHLPWLARFPPGSLAYESFAGRADAAHLLAADRLTTLPVHPTQLYEALGEVLLFAALVLVVRPRKRFHGQVLATWLLAYAVLRTTVEHFRGDVERGVVAGLGVGAWTSLLVALAGAAVWALAPGRRAGGAGAAEPTAAEVAAAALASGGLPGRATPGAAVGGAPPSTRRPPPV